MEREKRLEYIGLIGEQANWEMKVWKERDKRRRRRNGVKSRGNKREHAQLSIYFTVYLSFDNPLSIVIYK